MVHTGGRDGAGGVDAGGGSDTIRFRWFVGGGVENSLNFFGIAAPGWFMKTEYRVAEYDKKTLTETTLGGLPTGFGVTFNPIVQTVSTSIVYRFNWAGPVIAKY